MKIIFIRGLPGTGKTVISEKLRSNFLDAGLISVDKFKVNIMTRGFGFRKSNQIAQKIALDHLGKIYKNFEILFIEDVGCDKKFYLGIKKFSEENNCEVYWFRIIRKLSQLLKVESERKRKVRNSKKDFIKLKKRLEKIRIPGEINVKNDEMEDTVREILQVINNEVKG